MAHMGHKITQYYNLNKGVQMEEMGNVTAIKTFFEKGLRGRKVEMSEFKALTKEEREELGQLCRDELTRE